MDTMDTLDTFAKPTARRPAAVTTVAAAATAALVVGLAPPATSAPAAAPHRAAPAVSERAATAAPASGTGSATGASAEDRGPVEQLLRPIVIAHRGASGYRPEHTLGAYRLAIAMGADYIEPDVVSTKDGVLVARHENEISGTTDVEDRPRFADRERTKVIDGVRITGFFTEDFTFRELRKLRAEERLPDVRPQNTAYDGRWKVPTLVEVLKLVRSESRRRGETIGVYPETKHPTYFDSVGLSLEEPLVATLDRFGLDSEKDKVFVQSFETGNLRELDAMTDLRLVQLVDSRGGPYDRVAAGDPLTYAEMVTARGLAEVATYADGLGPNKDLVLPRDPATGATSEPSAVVDDAHASGLRVHVFTLRRENQFMATNFRVGTDPDAYGDLAAEVRAFLDAGVDGVFSDNPDVAVAARDAWVG